MITYKNTNSNAGPVVMNGIRRQTQFNTQVKTAKIEPAKQSEDRNNFETIVLGYMSTLQQEAETADNDALDDFLFLLKDQLAQKNPNIDDILRLIDNARF
jgi:hypothetical protein